MQPSNVDHIHILFQKKLPNSLLTDFHRWIYANKKAESVISLLEFIELEKSFKTVAEETINGITNETNSKARSYHTKLSCPVCNDEHSIVTCKRFLAMGINERWAVAKKKKLCYKCLKRNHLRQNCISKMDICQNKECKNSHSCLLHGSTKEKEQDSKHDESFIISMRTIPVIVRSGEKELLVNALLDDGSSQTFINTSIVNELGMVDLNKRSVDVGVVNGNNAQVDTSDVEFEILDKEKKSSFRINALVRQFKIQGRGLE